MSSSSSSDGQEQHQPLPTPLSVPLSQLSSPAAKLSTSVELRRRQESGEPVVNLAFGQSPFPPLESGVRALRQFADACHYLPTPGLEELRQMLVEFHEQYDGFGHFASRDVVVGPGARQLAFLISLVFDGPVFVPTPAWPAYAAQAALSSRRHWPVPLSAATDWKVNCDSLDRAARSASSANPSQPKLLIMCNPDNPTGLSYGRKELESLAGYLRSNSYIVVCDEVYARLHFEDEFYSLANYYSEGAVVVSGLSKWASLGGWRLGYALFPEELVELRLAVVSAASHTFACAPTPAQFAAVLLLHDLHSANAYMRQSRRVLAAVASYASRKLRTAGLLATEPQAGYSLLLDFEPVREHLASEGLTTGELLCERLLAELGTALLPCAGAFDRPADELTVRLCFVDFDGARALAECRSRPVANAEQQPLSDEFVRKFCDPTASAVAKLAAWVRVLRGESPPADDEAEKLATTTNGHSSPSATAEPSAPSAKDIEEYSKDLIDDVILIAQAEWVGCKM